MNRRNRHSDAGLRQGQDILGAESQGVCRVKPKPNIQKFFAAFFQKSSASFTSSVAQPMRH
jgi:hypothetical protein